MPEQRDINIFKIAQTTVDQAAVKQWLDSLGATEFEIPDSDSVSDPALLVALAGKRCYMSFEAGLNPNVTQIRSDYVKYFDNILASGHGSVLEHSVFTFAIENVSRVFTAEMNRHRAGWAISEGSLRFIRFDKTIPFWMPTSLQDQEGDPEEILNKKYNSRELFMQAFRHQEIIYGELLKIWDMESTDKNFAYKKLVTSCLRRIVGLGVATGGVWTGNVRALRHVLTMRCSPVAEEEILHVFSRIAQMIAVEQPLMFGDFAKSDDGYWRPKYVGV
jgi:thymidylate synthase (FAD)